MTRLDAEQIRLPIGEMPKAQLDFLEVFAEIESTNSYLMEKPAPQPGRFRVALAEHQTAGRGRMERRWHSPKSTGLCLSLSYTFSHTPEHVAAVTLAIGVGVAEALQRLGIRGVGLKWPNDIVVRDGKLGGILTEVRSAPGDAFTIIVGVGLNVDLRGADGIDEITPRIGYASDLASCVNEPPSRAMLSSTLIECIYNTLAEFESAGFGIFQASWDRLDWLRGQQVSIEMVDSIVDGLCEGIDGDGALLLRTDEGRQRILSGSVHLRKRGYEPR